jgi:hypothetical protein
VTAQRDVPAAPSAASQRATRPADASSQWCHWTQTRPV